VTPDASIIIVAYRSEDWLRRSLGALPEACRRPYEVIVVDNDSPDDSAGVVRREFPDAVLLEPAHNLGFARAVNLAARRARGRWLVLLNPDTEAHPGSLDALLDHAEAYPDAGVVGGRTLDEHGCVDPSSCWGVPSTWSTFCFATLLSTAFPRHRVLDPESLGRWERDDSREVGVVTGCLAAVRRDVWERLGGFDERFWMYGEDADLAVRMRAVGYRPRITPDAVVTHAVGASSSSRASKRVQVMRSKVTLARLHAPRWSRDVRVGLLVVGVALRAVLGRVSGRGDGWEEAWRRRGEWLPGYPAVDGQPGRVGPPDLPEEGRHG